MENILLLCLIALLVLFAALTLIRRAGRRGCCASGDYKPRKKKLARVIATKTFHVTGMHCENCARRVCEVVNDIPDTAGTVDLKTGTLTVSYAQEVPDELLKARLARAGYPVEESPAAQQ